MTATPLLTTRPPAVTGWRRGTTSLWSPPCPAWGRTTTICPSQLTTTSTLSGLRDTASAQVGFILPPSSLPIFIIHLINFSELFPFLMKYWCWHSILFRQSAWYWCFLRGVRPEDEVRPRPELHLLHHPPPDLLLHGALPAAAAPARECCPAPAQSPGWQGLLRLHVGLTNVR